MTRGVNTRRSRASSSSSEQEDVTTTTVLHEMLGRIEAMKTGMDDMKGRIDLPRARVPTENIPCFDRTRIG